MHNLLILKRQTTFAQIFKDCVENANNIKRVIYQNVYFLHKIKYIRIKSIERLTCAPKMFFFKLDS